MHLGSNHSTHYSRGSKHSEDDCYTRVQVPNAEDGDSYIFCFASFYLDSLYRFGCPSDYRDGDLGRSSCRVACRDLHLLDYFAVSCGRLCTSPVCRARMHFPFPGPVTH